MEGRRTGVDAALLVAFYQDGKGKQLRYLAGPWMVLSSGQARYAYAWALAAVGTNEPDSGGDCLYRMIDCERSAWFRANPKLLAFVTAYSTHHVHSPEYFLIT